MTFIRLTVSSLVEIMSEGRANENPGWGRIHVNGQNERGRWKRTRSIVNDGFGGEVNPKWNFKKDTSFKNQQWGKRLYENEKKKKIKKKKEKANMKRFENPWKRKIDLIEISSDDESDDDSWNGIYQTDINERVSKRSHKEMSSKIIKDMNKMTTRKERVLDEMLKVEKDQDLFLKWETVETVERKKVTETTEESLGYKTTTNTVGMRLDKIKIKIYKTLSEL